MKVLIVSFNFPPLNSIGSRRPRGFAEGFAREGHEVTVLTAKKPGVVGYAADAPGFRVVELEVNALNRVYRLLGIGRNQAQHRTETRSMGAMAYKILNGFRVRRGLLVLGRMPDLADFWIAPAVRFAQQQTWDIVITTYAPYASHLIGHRLKRKGRAGLWIADFRDGWAHSHNFRGLFPFTLAERFLERRIVRAADVVTTVSKILAERFARLGARSTRLVPNGFDFYPPDRKPGDRSKEETVVIAHTGTLYPRNDGLGAFIAGVQQFLHRSKLAKCNLVFRLAGADLCGFEERVQAAGLADYFEFFGVLPQESALELQWNCDALLFFDVDARYGVPTGKLYEYVAANVPILRFGKDDQSIASQLIKSTGTGIDVDIDPDGIADAIAAVVDRRIIVRPRLAAIEKCHRVGIARALARDICPP